MGIIVCHVNDLVFLLFFRHRAAYHLILLDYIVKLLSKVICHIDFECSYWFKSDFVLVWLAVLINSKITVSHLAIAFIIQIQFKLGK